MIYFRDVKITRYKNYGLAFKGALEENFFFCLFELDSKKIICLMLVENDDQIIEININYSNCFQFEYSFFDWWNKTFEYDKINQLQEVPIAEKELVNKYYFDNIFSFKNEKTKMIRC